MSKEKVLNDEWRVLKFSECIQQLNTGLNPRKNFSLGRGKIKYITAKNLTKSGTIDFSKCDFIDEEAKRIINKRSDIKVGDILFSSRAPIGQCHIIKEEPNYFDIGESIFSIRVNQEIVLPEYLCLYLSSDHFIKMASKNTTGSIISEIRVGDLMDITVIVPPKNVQKNIANCINTIDKKIENNNKINAELESMARTFYDYWFLQFEFPNEDGKPYKSNGGKMVWNEELKREIPEGWDVKKVADFLDVITGKEDANHSTENGTYSFFTCSNEILKCDDYKFEGKSVLIAGNGDFNIKYYDGRFNAYQRTYVLIPQDDKYVGVIYQNAIRTIKKFKNSSNGSIVKFITKGDVENILITVPSDEGLLLVFNEILETIENNKKGNQELASLRDFLLPLLMNGQVGFKEC